VDVPPERDHLRGQTVEGPVDQLGLHGRRAHRARLPSRQLTAPATNWRGRYRPADAVRAHAPVARPLWCHLAPA
jgi:hypothetical protein